MSAIPNPAPRRGSHIALVSSDGEPAQTAAQLIAVAEEEARNGRFTAARLAYERALTRLDETEPDITASAILREIARAHHAEGDGEAALDSIEAAIAAADARGDEADAGQALNVQAVVLWQRGDLDEAERLYLVSRARALRAGDAKLAATTAQNLGVLANIRGEYAVAQRHYEASLAEYRSLGLTEDVSYALNNLGLLHTATKRWDDAERAFAEAVQISDLAGDVRTRIVVNVNRAELWVARGDFARAQASISSALEAAAQTGDASAMGKATKLLGIIAREAGDLEAAEQHFVRADEIAVARQELLLEAEIARELADLARRMGRNRDALQQLNRSHRLFSRLRARTDVADVAGRMESLEHEFLHMARRWGESIEAKDRYTQGHCVRVAELACAIAARAGFDERSLFWFRIGALLHDVGKLVIPPEVLNKPGKLTDEEWALMRSHTTAGVEMLADIEFPWDIRPVVESHHERWDGQGYPHGLAGEAIPLVARILAIADVYDALTTVRSYKNALTHAEAVAMLRRDIGSLFDPRVFTWFEDVAESWPAQLANMLADRPAPEPLPAGEPVVEHAPGEYDDLTGMPLRRAFRETAERILAARRTTERPVSLLVIDIDHFKLVNDTFGHLQGDDVLRMVADQLRVNTRPSDYVARYAGDEFVVLLPGTRLEDACAVAERVREGAASAACARRDGSTEPLQVTVSIGASSAPMHGDAWDALFSAADAALYAAKRAGRDAVTAAGSPGGKGHDVLLECFIGRSAERQSLRRLIESASRGQPHVATLLGEAGIGKSALLRQMTPEVGIRAGSLLVGRCIEADIRAPFAPWADVLLGIARAGIVAKRSWRELWRLVPELGTAGAAPVAGSQHALLEELEEYLTLASIARPLVIVLDDMQWADSASWDALEYLLSRLDGQRILILLTIRAEDLPADGDARRRRLSRSERYSEMPLARLGRDDLAQWLRAALSGQPADPELVDYVASQSEGNPLFAVQTLRALVEDGRLYSANGRWCFESTTDLALPRAIGDLLARRLERLTPERREILTMAALLGREFDPDTLLAACDHGDDQVLDAIDAALAGGILAMSEQSPTALVFTHGLLIHALRTGVNPIRLRRMHGAVARALEARGVANPGEMAVHFDRAGCRAEAYRTALEAGQRAASVYAYESASEFFAIARRHAQELSEIADVEWQSAKIEELRGRYVEAEAHCDTLLSSLAAGAALLGILPAARRMRQRLLAQRGAPVPQLLEACEALLADARRDGLVDEVVLLLVMISSFHSRLGDTAAAERVAREASREAERVGSEALQADAAMRLGSSVIDGNAADAVPHYRQALDNFTRLGDRYGQLRCHINIGVACDRAGNHPAAEVSYATALEIGREIHASDLAGVASLNLGVLFLRTGNFIGARERFDEALARFGEIGNEPYRLAALYNLAHLSRAQGDAAGAVELYGAAVTLATSLEHVDVLTGALAGVGLAALDLGEVRAARQQQEAVTALRAQRNAWWFQGCEMCDALDVRLAATTDSAARALDTLLGQLTRADESDPYAGLWLAAECASVLAAGGSETASVAQRYMVHARALGYQPLIARLKQAA